VCITVSDGARPIDAEGAREEGDESAIAGKSERRI
jgi:hypothetical protein